MAEFTIYDYVDRRGANLVKVWLDGLAPEVSALFETKLRFHLALTEPGQWDTKQVKPLKGECKGLFEVRVNSNKVQWRLLGFHNKGREREVTLVCGAIEKDYKFEPLSTCRTANTRKADVESDLERFRRLHEHRHPTGTVRQPRGF